MIASIMISSSVMGYLFILMIKTAHVLLKKNRTIYMSVVKGNPQQKEKM